MAQALAIPASKPAPHLTLLCWGGVTLFGALLLPWARPGRDLFAFVPESTGWVLMQHSAWMATTMSAALAAIVLGVLPRSNVDRGRGAVLVGALGTALSSGYLFSQAQPFSGGPVVAILGFLAILGIGLALSGVLRADAFLAASILWVSAFVATFILLPLWSVLAASVYVKGRFTLTVMAEVLRSPAFFLLHNPSEPGNPATVAFGVGLLVGLGATVVALLARQRWRALAWGVEVGLAGWVLTILYLGFGALRNSVLLAITVGTLSTLLGFLFALLEQRSSLPTRRLLGAFSILPIITPPFVLGLAMIYLFGRRGFVTYQLLGISTSVFFGPVGVAVAQILAYAPIAFLVLQGIVRAIDATLEEAAETLGASRWHILRTVIWPLARPGIANAFLLVAIESLADFGNPIIVGGGAPFLATEVFFAIIGRFNPNEAAVYGVVLLAMTLSIFLLQRYWLGRASYVTVTGRPSAGQVQVLPPVLDYVVSGVFVLWIALVVALYGSVFVGSLTKLWGFDYTFTLKNLADLSPQGWQVFWTTAELSAYAAVPSTFMGFLIGYLVTRVDFRGKSLLEFSSMLSFATPGTVMGIGYILAFNQGALLLTGTKAIILLAFVFRNMPVGIRAGVAAIHQIDRSLEEASTMLRATSAITLRRIVMPLVRPALLSGLVFAFVRAMTAVSQVIFLITPATNLATTQILSYVEYGSQGRGAALASLLTVFMIAVVLLLYAFNRRLDPRSVSEVAVT